MLTSSLWIVQPPIAATRHDAITMHREILSIIAISPGSLSFLLGIPIGISKSILGDRYAISIGHERFSEIKLRSPAAEEGHERPVGS